MPPRGPAGTKLLRVLLGEVPWASLSPVTRNANGTSRYSTTAGALSLLEGLTHAVFLPQARHLASAAATATTGAAGVVADHFSARLATLLLTLADAGDDGQDMHYDRAGALCFHFVLTTIPQAEGTRLWLGSHRGIASGTPVQHALPAGALLVTMGNLVHAGAPVDGPRGHARVFAYVQCPTAGAPLHALVSRAVTGASGGAIAHFTAEATLPDVLPLRDGPRRSDRACNCCV